MLSNCIGNDVDLDNTLMTDWLIMQVLLDSEVSPSVASLEGNDIVPVPVVVSGGETPLETALASAVAAVEPAVKPSSGKDTMSVTFSCVS